MDSNAPRAGPPIEVRGARQHNLKNIDVDIPRGAMTVITGVSGSGKSSLAFDTLYAEGQRRYVESVSSYAKQFLDRLPRPEVDVIHGIMPAVAIRQSAPTRSARSTVGTATEIHDYLRLLFARLGTVHCGQCGEPVQADSPERLVRESADWTVGERLLILAPVLLFAHASWAEQAADLVRAGFTRIRQKNEVVPLEPLPKLSKGTRSVEVVIDRFTWRPDEKQRLAESAEQAFRRGEGQLRLLLGERDLGPRSERWDCSRCGTAAVRPEPTLFSFNSPYGVCPECRGFANVLTFTVGRIVPHPEKTLREGAIDPWARSWRSVAWPRLQKIAAERKIPLDVPWKDLDHAHRTLLIEGCKGFRGAIPFLERLQARSYKAGNRFIVKRYQDALPCGSCAGTRLRPEALRVRLGGRHIAEVTALTVRDVAAFIEGLPLSEVEAQIAGPVLTELRSRLTFLDRVDLGYLTLERMTRTLSGGEMQRIELANALGSQLADTLYVLDEPTIGLHPRDTERLMGILESLAGRGNTLVVVEHEPMLMRAADHLIDLGPGAGEGGGQILYAGDGAGIFKHRGSETAAYLRREKVVSREPAPGSPERFIEIRGARHHNLSDIDVRIPIGRMTAVTGVSGSGKSSLVEDTLSRAAQRALGEGGEELPGAHREIRGLEALERVVVVDQSPIGRTPRSCPVTYLGAYAKLRQIYARQPAALARGLKDGAFSFNTPGGRCEQCQGAGWVTVEMYFLADLMVPCESCDGARFRSEVLDVRYRGLHIREALDLTVDQAFEHFAREPRFTRALHILRRVGLGYLRLGQPATQLSGGEAQRLKIARELSERGKGAALYVLDEPTVGLHFADVQRLLEVLDDLTGRGDTVVLVEHNLDVIRNCDWIVDLGPGGGDQGGQLVAEGPPAVIMSVSASSTGRFLAADAEAGAAHPAGIAGSRGS